LKIGVRWIVEGKKELASLSEDLNAGFSFAARGSIGDEKSCGDRIFIQQVP